MATLMIKINKWKNCVVFVVLNNPPNKPIPLDRKTIQLLNKTNKVEYSKIFIVNLLKSIDLSRRNVTELDNSKKSREYISI